MIVMAIRIKLWADYGRFVGWVDARKPNNFLEYFHNFCWVSPFEPMGNTGAIMIAQPNLRLD